MLLNSSPYQSGKMAQTLLDPLETNDRKQSTSGRMGNCRREGLLLPTSHRDLMHGLCSQTSNL
ncbi:MAG TPA: hypothetical protein VMY59_08280 [Candidatus Thermoplasmatota archaeon]|nr:hypothetical protein [Candidatus Thermoplasmatota archaeon]